MNIKQFYQPSRLQLSDRIPQSDKLSLSESSSGEVLINVPLPLTGNPLSTLNHIETEQPCNQTGQANSGPIGKHVACTDHGLHIPNVKCFFRKLFTRFSTFSKFLYFSDWIFNNILLSEDTGKDMIKLGCGRAARIRWKSGSSNDSNGGVSTLNKDKYMTSSDGEIDCVANKVNTSSTACCRSKTFYYIIP